MTNSYAARNVYTGSNNGTKLPLLAFRPQKDRDNGTKTSVIQPETANLDENRGDSGTLTSVIARFWTVSKD